MFRWLLITVFLAGCASSPEPIGTCSSINSCAVAVRSKLVSNLLVDDVNYEKPFIIRFFLNDKAEVINHEILADGENEKLENSVMDAIEKSSPFVEILGLSKSDFEEFKEIKLTVDLSAH